MNNLEIGIVTIRYSEDGSVEFTSFAPTMKLDRAKELAKELSSVRNEESQDTLKHNADRVLASWINQINTIELADREEYEIVSEIVECERHDNNKIKQCSIKYTFKKIK